MNRPPLLPGSIPSTHFCWRLSRHQCHGAAGRTKSMTNSTDSTENRIGDLPACGAVTHPHMLPNVYVIAHKALWNQ